jgi:hypothetical protein
MDKMSADQIRKSHSVDTALKFACQVTAKSPDELQPDDFALASRKAHFAGNDELARILSSLAHFTEMVDSLRQEPRDRSS